MKLCMIPGWGLGQAPLLDFATRLEAAPPSAGGARLVAKVLPLPGYDGSPAVADFPAAVQQLAQSIPQDALLMGWSLGGLLAMAIAAQQPVRGLILLSSTPSFLARPHWPHGLPGDVLSAFSQNIEAAPLPTLQQFIRGFNRGDRLSKPLFRELSDLPALPATPAVLRQGLDWLRDIDLCTTLSAIHCPTLILHGEEDPLMPIAGATALASQIAGAQLHCLAQRAHAPFALDAEEALAATLAFCHTVCAV